MQISLLVFHLESKWADFILHCLFSLFSMSQNLAEKRHFPSFWDVNHYFTSTFHHKLFNQLSALHVFDKSTELFAFFNSFGKDGYSFKFPMFCPQKTCLRKYLREHDRLTLLKSKTTDVRECVVVGGLLLGNGWGYDDEIFTDYQNGAFICCIRISWRC